jgi:hypothetical protein
LTLIKGIGGNEMAKEKLNKQVVKFDDRKLLVMKITREKGKAKLYLQTDEAIENIFRKEDIHDSENYTCDKQPLRYYDLLEGEEEESYKSLMSNIRLNSYGSNFIIGSYSMDKNISILRSVGISQGITIEINRLISEEMLTEWANILKDFVAKLYKNFVRPLEISVTIEKREVV